MPNHVLQLICDENADGVGVSFTPSAEVWATYNIAFDSTYANRADDGPPYFAGTISRLYQSDYDIEADVDFLSNGTIQKWEIDISDSGFHSSTGGGPLVPMQFYQVEMHYVAATGILQVYVDGALVGALDGDTLTDIGFFYLSGGYPGGTITTTGLHTYVDDVKVGTTRGASDLFSDDFEGSLPGGWNDWYYSPVASIIVDPGIAAPVPAAPPTIHGKYNWTMKIYNYTGANPDNVDYSDYSEDITTNELLHATNRQLNFYLNGVDDCSFTLYLDDPAASHIIPTKTVVKVWRTVYGDDGITIIYSDEDDVGFPCFVGTVSSTLKDGDANTMNVQCFSPLWRLQSRFHVRNHYLVNDQDTGDQYTGSGIIFKVIDLLNTAFPATGDAYTGIEQGTADWVDEPHIAPYFIAKGTNSWAIINDDIMARPNMADIFPQYNDDSTDVLCILNTLQKRGDDISADIIFRYHTGTNDNCDNLTEEFSANPGEFANFLWVIGQGGPNSGKVAIAWDNTAGEFSSNNIGLYMKTVDKSEVKRVTALVPIATSELKQSKIPKGAYTVTINPYGGLIFNKDYKLGDIIHLLADKDALQVDKDQRIYQIGLSISDNNVEIASPIVANDFYGKIA